MKDSSLKLFENDLWLGVFIESQLKVFDTLKSKSSENFEELILPVEKASIILKAQKIWRNVFKNKQDKKFGIKMEKNVSMQ